LTPPVDRAIRALRRPKSPSSETAFRRETEIFPDGRPREIGTVYLRNGECPLACLYCALYEQTDDRPSTGAEIAEQIGSARSKTTGIAGLKLYNASSLFEPNSIRQNPEDLAAIAHAVRDLDLVVVEARSENAHRALDFAPFLSGRLEVAIGLEVADDGLLALLNKPTTVGRFRQAARSLREAGILLRAFCLVQPPFVSRGDARRIALETVDLAAAEGARVVSLLPVLAAHEPMERLRRAGFFAETALEDFFDIVLACVGRGPVVVAETQGLERLPGCPNCRAKRVSQLVALNATGEISAVSCRNHLPARSFEAPRPRPAEVLSALTAP
jgi:radical SAM enzyme (TIGR01210 family)